MEKKPLVLKKSPFVTFTKNRRSKESKLMTVEEVAALLRVPVSWIYSRSRCNTIPIVRVGKYVRFNEDEITTWANAGCPKQWAPKKPIPKAHHPLTLKKR
jgi:excisionase family DNA binding protein